jgi:hypothetical protein
MIEALAASVVALVAPYLGKAAEEAAKTVGKEGAEAGFRLLGWLRGKVSGRAREALEDAEKAPSAVNEADLRKQLARLLEARPELVAELQALVPPAVAEVVRQSMTLGDNSTGVENNGNNNAINITR